MSEREVVEELYVRAYGRLPTEEELRIGTKAFTGEGVTRKTATEDLMWAMMNSAEFVFNH
jgi:hypothetical protein